MIGQMHLIYTGHSPPLTDYSQLHPSCQDWPGCLQQNNLTAHSPPLSLFYIWKDLFLSVSKAIETASPYHFALLPPNKFAYHNNTSNWIAKQKRLEARRLLALYIIYIYMQLEFAFKMVLSFALNIEMRV